MLLELSADQDVLRETTARFLDAQVPVDRLRELRDHDAGFDDDYWVRGVELGWTSLLVDESMGGGSISDSGLLDLVLVAHEFGRHAAPGPLVTTNLVASALSAAGTGADVVTALLDGSGIAAWCHDERGPFGTTTTEIRTDGDELVVDGEKRPVESADQATHFLVSGRTNGGMTQVLVPADAAGVTVTPLESVDLTRRFGTVRFDGVRVPVDAAVGGIGDAADEIERLLLVATVLLDAEAVGAMQSAFDMTVEWAFDRYTFGRPLASYQALKHRFADMKSWLEAGHAISDEAAGAVAADDERAALLASASRAFIGEYGSELLQECVQIHGGIGVTFEHDLHLYLRRHTVDRAVHGTPSEHRQRITDLMEAQAA